MYLRGQQPLDVMVGLDIGTTKICAVAARHKEGNELEILGVGKVDAEGVRKGVISNIDIAVKSIRGAIEQCEQCCGFSIQNVYVGIAGHHIQGINMEGVVAVRGGKVEEQDIERVIDAARAFHAPDKELIHILSQEYTVDDQDGIKNPLGMAGKRLQAKVHIVLASTTALTNIVQSCNMAGLKVADIVLEPLASSLSVLHLEERQEKVIMIDIGGGTSDIAIFNRDSVVHTSVLPLGGNNLTKDIAFGLRISNSEATRIKHEDGVAMRTMVNEGDLLNISVQGGPDRIVEKRVLSIIMEERLSEMFELIKDMILKSINKDIYDSRIVLTGGSSLIPGIQDLSKKVLEIPTRIGKPLNIIGVKDFVDSPIFSGVVGFIRYGIENKIISYPTNQAPNKTRINVSRGMVEFLKKFF
ncbi:MAG: cell division protein FtsA [SAR324 cluster bacterium]|nr:cell division protein FtsA [SAR324 cluster bacterium]